jgi:hypothetical protein
LEFCYFCEAGQNSGKMRKPSYLVLITFLLILPFILTGCKKEKDTTKPVITILGANPITACVDVPYSDPGATASDDKDGDLTSKITVTIDVNVSVEGTGHVFYEVKDNAGNTASATRIVNIIFCK